MIRTDAVRCLRRFTHGQNAALGAAKAQAEMPRVFPDNLRSRALALLQRDREQDDEGRHG